MSTPINELSKYRSYSYYHVLAICDSTETASELASNTSLDVWQHPTENAVQAVSKYSVKNVPGSGNYCVLINGSTDADFTITKAEWTSTTAASTTASNRNTSIAMEGLLQLSEPRGVVLMNQIVQCCMALGVDSANAVWVLKTFFVGYKFDPDASVSSGDSVDYIYNIPPIMFLAYDVTGTFGVEGGDYEIHFVSMANGASRLPQYSKLPTAANVSGAGSLAQTLKLLQKVVQDDYDSTYRCIEDQVGAVSPELKDKLRPVKYLIDCEAPYIKPDGSPNTAYTVAEQPSAVKNTKCGTSLGGTPAGVSIDSAIHRILEMCSKIKEDATIGENGNKFIPKIQTWSRSYGVDDGGKRKIYYEVGYRVTQQQQPQTLSFDQFNNGSVASGDAAKNVIEFDYLYTGKNTDILEFDLKMNMGMVYLQSMTLQQSQTTPGQDTATRATIINAPGLARADNQNIPVYFNTLIKAHNVKDTSNARTSSQYAYSMSKHASLEMLETTFKITGNSQLLGSINSTSNSERLRDNTKPVILDDGYAKFDNWSLSPSFVKVNIKMPRNNDDESLFTGSQTSRDSARSNDYAVDFWFKGYYYVYSIDHTFENGVFTQTISALSIPEKNSFNTTDPSMPPDKNIELVELEQSCYNHTVGCGGKGATSSTLAKWFPEVAESLSNPSVKQIALESAMKPNIPTSPTLGDFGPAAPVAATNATTSASRSNIANFDKTAKDHPEIISAIDAAAAEHKVDPFVLTQFVAFESKFNPNAVSSTGCTGLGQFSEGTWKQFGYGPISNRNNANLNARATANLIAYNQDKLTTFLGRAPTTTELYMAHQQGLGGAKQVLGKIKSGNGSDPSGLSAKNLKANNVKDSSANGVYNTMQTQMGRVLTNGLMQKDMDAGKTSNTSSIMDSVKKPQFGGLVASAPKAVVDDNATPPKMTNRDAVAASRNCEDQAKKVEASKTDECKQDTPPAATTNPATPSAKNNDTGQATPNKNQTAVIMAKPTAGQETVKLSHPTEDMPTIMPDTPKVVTTPKRFM